VLLSLAMTLGLAVVPVAALTPAQEAEARRIESMLIAPCCWSQQVSVHQSPAADEIRQDIRRRLARGESQQQILDDYVVQFGMRILAVPPARGFSRVLYVIPPVALVAGAGLVVVLVRRFSARTGILRQTGEGTGATAAARTDAGYERRLDEELDDLQ
jgi:cytochrome c-type biogenesis protein CcmH